MLLSHSLKTNKRWEQKQLLLKISRNSQKFEKQFPFISSYFSELNTSVPTSTYFFESIPSAFF
ncbi:hypothetical protein EIA52_04510 [Enterococcus durans]|nr:hypothetical protein EIA52_04510 [Enterococcus durans]